MLRNFNTYIRSFIITLPGVLMVAAATRLLFHLLGFEDYWGDSYHNLIISWDTVDHDWLYSDYKYRQFVWLPAYRYLVTPFMFLFDNYCLVIPQALNVLLGVGSCYLVYRLTEKLTHSKPTAWFSSLTLALLPWHVAFSHYNMSENLCGVLLLLTVMALIENRNWLLIVSIGIGVLCRNEMIFLYFVVGVSTIVWRKWRTAGLIGGITLLCLGAWMWWCYENTGNAIYWLTQRVWGSTNDAEFSKEDRGPFYIVLVSLLQAFPMVMLLIPIIARNGVGTFIKKQTKFELLPCFIVLSHWLFVFVLQFKFFSYPDPHYFVISLPLATVFYGQVIHEFAKKELIKWSMMVSLVTFFCLLPTFYFLPFTNYQSKIIGGYIKKERLYNGDYLMDFPVAIYHGEIPFELVRSTDQLLEFDLTDMDRDKAFRFIKNNDIKYIMSQDVSFSNALRIWPEMAQAEPFKFSGLEFIPIYIYNPKQELSKNWLHEYFVQPIYINKGTAILWRVSS